MPCQYQKGTTWEIEVKLKKIINFSGMHYNVSATVFIECYLLYLGLQDHDGLAV